VLAGCADPRPSPPPPSTAAPAGSAGASFPELPTTAEAAEALVRRETARAPGADPPLDAAAILAAAERGPVAGREAVTRWIQAFLDRAGGDAHVLFGTWHDAPGQIDAFRRLIGPGGLRGLTLVAVEQLRADGAWRGAPLELQRGDGAALEAYLGQGDRDAFEALRRGHREADYAAWKLGYEDAVLDLLVTARATGTAFVGCDMPGALQERLGAVSPDVRNRLREIHCLRSLPPSTKPRRVAMLWGQAHVRPGGFPRFLAPPASTLAIAMFGHRSAHAEVEGALAKALAIADPVLIPLSGGEAALLLPDEVLGARIDRVFADASADGPGLAVRAEIDGVLSVGDRTFTVSRDARAIPLPEGEHTYAFTGGGMRFVGALRLAAGRRVELGFDPRDRSLSHVERPAR
jgi:hypothetical protein